VLRVQFTALEIEFGVAGRSRDSRVQTLERGIYFGMGLDGGCAERDKKGEGAKHA
jgi:hypothetical protein